jgi:hypothetical protein
LDILPIQYDYTSLDADPTVIREEYGPIGLASEVMNECSHRPPDKLTSSSGSLPSTVNASSRRPFRALTPAVIRLAAPSSRLNIAQRFRYASSTTSLQSPRPLASAESGWGDPRPDASDQQAGSCPHLTLRIHRYNFGPTLRWTGKCERTAVLHRDSTAYCQGFG